MTKKDALTAEPCPVARSVDLVGDRWSLLIVRDAFDGMRRFTDFQRNLGVARNILADRLRRLVEAGVLVAQPTAPGGAYHEYVLTARGQRLFAVVVALRQWGEDELFAPGEAHSDLVEKKTGKRLARMAPVGEDGNLLAPGDTEVRKLPQ